jgi:hypothetical protein
MRAPSPPRRSSPRDHRRGARLHALDANGALLLAALQLDRLSGAHLGHGRPLQPGPGGQRLQRARRQPLAGDPCDPGAGTEDGGHGPAGCSAAGTPGQRRQPHRGLFLARSPEPGLPRVRRHRSSHGLPGLGRSGRWSLVPFPEYPAGSLPAVRPGCAGLAPGGPGDLLPPHWLDHAGRGAQGRGHQRPAGGGHRHPCGPAPRLPTADWPERR